MELPPTQMRHGYDSALARVLRVDKAVLFGGYKRVSPQAAAIVSAEVIEDFEGLKRKAHAVIELLDGDGLREMHERGRSLLKKEMATSAA